MNDLVSLDFNMDSKYLLELELIRQKHLSNHSLTFRDKIIYKIRTFLSPNFVIRYDDIALSKQKYAGICIICNDTYDTKHYPSNILGKIYKFFVICNKCINTCTNIDTFLIKPTLYCDERWMCMFAHTSKDYDCVYSDRINAIDMLHKIINNHLKLVDIFYDHKIVLLLMMSYNDDNCVLNVIPRDIIIYMWRLIYCGDI